MNLKYDPKTSRNWRLLTSTTPASESRDVQNIDLDSERDKDQEETEETQEAEDFLRENLTRRRNGMDLTTVFNRRADSILRDVLNKAEESNEFLVDKRDLRQLYRAYYTHGFVLNLRYDNFEELSTFLASTRIHTISGPVEYSLVCRIKRYVGTIRSILLAVVVLRSKS